MPLTTACQVPRPARGRAALTALGLLAACAEPLGTAGSVPEPSVALGAAPSHGARAAGRNAPEGEAKLVVDTGWDRFRVNVRYITLISGMIIAVRQETGDAPRGWERMRLDQPAPGAADLENLSFKGPAYEDAAVRIAADVARRVDVCAPGELTLERAADGEPKRMYRGEHQAWVVFAACTPES